MTGAPPTCLEISAIAIVGNQGDLHYDFRQKKLVQGRDEQENGVTKLWQLTSLLVFGMMGALQARSKAARR